MDELVKTVQLTKRYGNTVALKDVDLSLPQGKIIGLLGPNGSGKTTLLKIIAGICRPSSGEVYVLNKPLGLATKKIVSYMPDKAYFYKWMKISDAIDYYRDFYEDFNSSRCSELLDFMDLNTTYKIASLSKGMVEKLQLVLTLSRNAQLYILDEPIGGVDLITREKILNSIVNFYDVNCSILITSHLVADIEKLFDTVIFIKDGEIALYSDVEELRIQRGKSIEDCYREVFA